jgi:predicted Zn-dependent protease
MFLPGLWKLINWRFRRHLAEGRPDKAARVAAWYVRLRPRDVEGWADLGDALIHRGDLEAAAIAMQRGLERLPNQSRLTYMVAKARLEQGRLDEAEVLLHRARRDSLDACFVDLGLVEVAAEQGNFRKALQIATEAADHIPHDWPWVKFQIATQIMPVEAGRPLAERLFREAAAALPKNQSRYGLSHLYLGALIEGREPKEAAEHFKEAKPTGAATETLIDSCSSHAECCPRKGNCVGTFPGRTGDF